MNPASTPSICGSTSWKVLDFEQGATARARTRQESRSASEKRKPLGTCRKARSPLTPSESSMALRAKWPRCLSEGASDISRTLPLSLSALRSAFIESTSDLRCAIGSAIPDSLSSCS